MLREGNIQERRSWEKVVDLFKRYSSGAKDRAKEVSRLDIGQTVIVKKGTVLAVEAFEGTNEALKRGGGLGKGEAMMVKVSKPNQDFRFDLPATGKRTIETLAIVNGAVLAVEAGQSLVFDREEMVAEADRAGLVVIGLSENDRGELVY